MDASISAAGVAQALSHLLDDGDFEGAEELLTLALTQAPARLQSFYHHQFGRVYMRWNKLSSAVAHLNQAAELAHLQGEEILLIQVVEDLRLAKDKQQGQRP